MRLSWAAFSYFDIPSLNAILKIYILASYQIISNFILEFFIVYGNRAGKFYVFSFYLNQLFEVFWYAKISQGYFPPVSGSDRPRMTEMGFFNNEKSSQN